MSGGRPQNCSEGNVPMTANEHRDMAADLLDLVWQMEQILKDYCRLLAAHDDGHWLETKNKKNKDKPF
jgi:hypothetical protein